MVSASAPDDAVGPAAVKTGGDAGQPAHQEHQRDRGDGDAEIEPRRDHDPAENIAAELVGAEPVLRGRRLERRDGVARERIVGNQRRTEQRREHDQQKQRERESGDRVLAQHVADVVERRGETRWRRGSDVVRGANAAALRRRQHRVGGQGGGGDECSAGSRFDCE